MLVLFLLPISEYQSAPRAAKRKAKKKVAKIKLRVHGFSFKNGQSIPLSIVGFKWENLAGKIRRLTKNFVAKYQMLHNEIPNQFAADAYDGVYALAAAIEAAGVTAETSPEDACEMLISVFPGLEITGVTGTMCWDATGEVDKSPMAVVIENGVYVNAK